jgi:hypothetical protein
VITCKTCDTVATHLDSDHGRPIGWYLLRIGGDPGPGVVRVKPGSYCSAECLCIAVHAFYGVSAQATREWLHPPEEAVG